MFYFKIKKKHSGVYLLNKNNDTLQPDWKKWCMNRVTAHYKHCGVQGVFKTCGFVLSKSRGFEKSLKTCGIQN